jgi:hypothetical protein
MKSIGRLRWVVDKDREDLVSHEAGDRSHGDGGAEQESLSERVLKNLALIRAYEAKAD